MNLSHTVTSYCCTIFIIVLNLISVCLPFTLPFLFFNNLLYFLFWVLFRNLCIGQKEVLSWMEEYFSLLHLWSIHLQSFFIYGVVFSVWIMTEKGNFVLELHIFWYTGTSDSCTPRYRKDDSSLTKDPVELQDSGESGFSCLISWSPQRTYRPHVSLDSP